MARQNALLRLQITLRLRRADLCNTRADQVANLRHVECADRIGDSADAAFEADSDEVSSQLAELDSRELSRVERALARLKQGKYGICENCETRIPLARLNILPYATLCINCERQREMYRGLQAPLDTGNWDRVVDSDAPTLNQRISSSEMELGLSSNH